MKMRLLLIDDDKPFLGAMAHDIEKRYKHKVYTATSPEEAERYIKKVDVCISDWEMGKWNGGDSLRLCQKHNVPFLLWSGDPDCIPEKVSVEVEGDGGKVFWKLAFPRALRKAEEIVKKAKGVLRG